MITPGTFDITCFQGADFDQQFVVSQGGTALNWTNFTARMQVREAADATATLLSLSTGGSGIVLGGTAGTIALSITNAQSAAVSAGSFAYDLELQAGDGQVTRLLQGSFNVVGNVTR
jgi:hypothetical protein